MVVESLLVGTYNIINIIQISEAIITELGFD